MSETNASMAAEIAVACENNAADACEALQRALDGEFALSVEQPEDYDAATDRAGGDGPGLALLFRVGGQGAALLLPAASQLLPEWYQSPDVSQSSKLGTLAQELSMLLLPDSLAPDHFAAAGVASLSSSVAAAAPDAGAKLVSLVATRGDLTGRFSLIWPLTNPAGLLESATASQPTSRSSVAAPTPSPASGQKAPGERRLPVYSRSLLKVRVPVYVELAQKRESIHEIVEISPGTILKFDKSCSELLRFFVGGHPIAEGEAVKVGDKFGFRVSSITAPNERFKPLRGAS